LKHTQLLFFALAVLLTACGRDPEPPLVTVDPRGALIIADDLSNTVWRVTPTR
jgi:glucose/arabinose dehydrogenase